VLTSCIEGLLEHNNLHDSYQSAYRRGNSTETDLLKVPSDIAEDLDEGSTIALIMFGLSGDFDVSDHSILLNSIKIFL